MSHLWMCDGGGSTKMRKSVEYEYGHSSYLCVGGFGICGHWTMCCARIVLVQYEYCTRVQAP